MFYDKCWFISTHMNFSSSLRLTGDLWLIIWKSCSLTSHRACGVFWLIGLWRFVHSIICSLRTLPLWSLSFISSSFLYDLFTCVWLEYVACLYVLTDRNRHSFCLLFVFSIKNCIVILSFPLNTGLCTLLSAAITMGSYWQFRSNINMSPLSLLLWNFFLQFYCLHICLWDTCINKGRFLIHHSYLLS